MIFDPEDNVGRHALGLLEHAFAAWLTTVTPEGQPQSMPIWFTWDPSVGETGEIVVYSDHRAKRNVNVAAHPLVSFHLAGRSEAEDFVTIDGMARIDLDYPAVGDNPRYLAKYGKAIERNNGGAVAFGRTYSVPIRITPTRGRAAEA